MTNLIVLEAATINRMIRDQRFLDAFPFLRAAADASLRSASQKQGCSKCGSKNRRVTEDFFNQIKQSIVGMSDTDKGLLKTLLGARQLQVHYTMPSGPFKVTF